jgi:hypothetical protein
MSRSSFHLVAIKNFRKKRHEFTSPLNLGTGIYWLKLFTYEYISLSINMTLLSLFFLFFVIFSMFLIFAAINIEFPITVFFQLSDFHKKSRSIFCSNSCSHTSLTLAQQFAPNTAENLIPVSIVLI